MPNPDDDVLTSIEREVMEYLKDVQVYDEDTKTIKRAEIEKFPDDPTPDEDD